MKILKEGILPGKRVYRTSCTNCYTKFEFPREEATTRQTGYNESSLVIKCPLKGCGREIYIDEAAVYTIEK